MYRTIVKISRGQNLLRFKFERNETSTDAIFVFRWKNVKKNVDR